MDERKNTKPACGRDKEEKKKQEREEEGKSLMRTKSWSSRHPRATHGLLADLATFLEFTKAFRCGSLRSELADRQGREGASSRM